MTKTAQALIWSIESISDGRFWTFTVPREQSPRETAAMWRRLAWELKRSLGFRGIRVFEMHPGGHGLHVHVVTDSFFDVNEVRSISDRMGWGRVNVKRIRKGVSDFEDQAGVSQTGNVARYLAKYLVKQLRQRLPALKGLRMWAAFGGLKDHCKVCQVEVVSTVSTIIKLLPCQAVADFFGKNRVETKKKLAYWRMRLAMLIWAGRVPSLDSYLELALAPCPL